MKREDGSGCEGQYPDCMNRGWLLVGGSWLAAGLLAAAEALSPLSPPPLVPLALVPLPLVPLATAGTDHELVVSALIAVGRGDPTPLAELPAHVLQDAPAISAAGDPDLARRWPLLVPEAIARLPAADRQLLASRLDERFHAAGPHAHAVDYLPAPAAEARLAVELSQAFDHGRLLSFLVLAATTKNRTQQDPRITAARLLLGLGEGVLSDLGLPQMRSGPPPMLLQGGVVRGDGWLFGCDADGRVRWQRRTERLARIAVGLDGAVVAEAAGVAAIDIDGTATSLPPLPGFARPLAIHGGIAWFAAGTTVWQLDVAQQKTVHIELPESPLGQPIQRGGDGWWLTRSYLLHTHNNQIVQRLPHLLALSTVATLERHPHGAVIRDGERWWLVQARSESTLAQQAESFLLEGQRTAAATLLKSLSSADGEPEDIRALRVRVTLENPQNDQEKALLTLVAKADPSTLAGNPLLTEPATNLNVPAVAWPHRMTLMAWKLRGDQQVPHVTLEADPLTVRLRAQWSPERWWERSWPTRPLLDAPSRTWARNGDALAIADGAGHLLVVDTATGQRVVEADVPTDVDPSLVIRCGPNAAALLAALGKTLLLVEDRTVRSVPVNPPGRSLTYEAGAVVVHSASGKQLVPLNP